MDKPLKNLIEKGLLPNPYEIKPKDYAGLIDIAGDFGRVQHSDVGKLIYLRDGLIYMENDEQKQRRLG